MIYNEKIECENSIGKLNKVLRNKSKEYDQLDREMEELQGLCAQQINRRKTFASSSSNADDEKGFYEDEDELRDGNTRTDWYLEHEALQRRDDRGVTGDISHPLDLQIPHFALDDDLLRAQPEDELRAPSGAPLTLGPVDMYRSSVGPSRMEEVGASGDRLHVPSSTGPVYQGPSTPVSYTHLTLPTICSV